MITLSPFKWASFNFFGFFCAYGVMLPFLPVWLKHYGYSAEMIGLIASVGYIFRFLGGLLASQRVKHVDHLIPTARGLTWLNLAVIPFIFLFADNIWVLFPLLMLFHIFNAGAMPIADSIASIWQQQVGLDYGKSRLFGSIAFVVGSLSCGYFVGFFRCRIGAFYFHGVYVIARFRTIIQAFNCVTTKQRKSRNKFAKFLGNFQRTDRLPNANNRFAHFRIARCLLHLQHALLVVAWDFNRDD